MPPNTAHLIIQHTDGDLYTGYTTKMYTSKNNGSTWSLLNDVTYTIKRFYYDRTNSLLYFAAFSASNYWYGYYDLSDDSYTSKGGGGGYDVWDIFGCSSDVVLLRNDDIAGPQRRAVFQRVDSTTDYFNMGDPTARTNEMSRVVVIGDDAWVLWKWSDENVELWKWDNSGGTFTEMHDFGSNTDLPDDDDMWVLAYDEDNLIYMILKDTSDSKNYLWSYSISGDTATKGDEANLIIQVDRHNFSSGDTPNNTEKAISSLGDSKIYKFNRDKTGFFIIQDISSSDDFTEGSTIISIADNIIIINNSGTYEVWEQKETFGSYFRKGTVKRLIQEISKATLEGVVNLSPNQYVEIWSDETEVS
jgi:hypothetical protein